MEHTLDVRVLLGALIVTLVGLHRFNVAPPPKPTLSSNVPRPLGILKEIFRVKDEPISSLFPPPRAHTTFFKFALYRTAYALTGAMVYLVLYAIPGVARDVDQFLRIGTKQIPVLEGGGPIFIAFVVALLFPVIPPFRAGERVVRRAFYERACIPAQQLRERHRLKHAKYLVDGPILLTMRESLTQEDFEPADLQIDEVPTTRSLWTKAAVLMAHIERCQGEDAYKTAFATLREQDGTTRSVDRINQVYEALKGDARVCFKAVRERPGEPETEAREGAFRHNSKELLDSIYDFLSRVSLHSHYTDRERVTRMREVGFVLSPSESGPIPDSNDVAALGVLVACIVFLPLSYYVGTPRAILISVEVYATIMIPILIAARFPSFAKTRPSGTPAVAFPLAAGLVAAVVGLAAHTLVLSYAPGDAPWFDLSRGWASYSTRSYPWSVLLFLIAVLISWRMRVGAYPEPGSLQGFARIMQWGSAVDGGLFLAWSLALVALYVRPKVVQLRGDQSSAADWSLLLIPAGIAAVIGFFVPTWYRAHAATKKAAPTLCQGDN